MIPAPKLDDRTYADIVAEAMRLIPRYCPEWTNHNASDFVVYRTPTPYRANP